MSKARLYDYTGIFKVTLPLLSAHMYSVALILGLGKSTQEVAVATTVYVDNSK